MIKKLMPAIVLMNALFLPAVFPVGTHEKGAGNYEMTTYYVALLYRGPNSVPEVTQETKRLQEAHLANIRKMAETGKLVLAGPFSDNGNLRGMFVLTVNSMEEAQAVCDNDPAVKAGRLTVELHPWYSAKGIRVDPPKQQ